VVERFHPDNVQVEITEDCNHGCFYCYNHWRTDDPSRNKMTVETASGLVDVLKEDIKPFDVVITGGEPLMNLPALETIAKGLERPYGINTNLSIMTPKRLGVILEANPLVTFLVSVPSLHQETFEEIVGRDRIKLVTDGLKLLSDEGLSVYANMVAHALNLDQVRETGRILHEEYGVKGFSVTPVLRPAKREDSPHYLDREGVIQVLEATVSLGEDFGMAVNVLEVVPPCFLPEHLREVEMIQKGCSAGRTTMQINYEGGVRVCTQSPLVVGNLFEDGFDQIWESMRPYRENENVPGECFECDSLPSCGGGCRFEGYQDGDALDRRDSRMREPIKKRETLWRVPEIDNSREYNLVLAMSREEPDGTFTLYNGRKTLNVNRGLRDFVLGLKENGKTFKVGDYSEGMRKRAEYIGAQLLDGGFLV
jgi:radical SAM protein with 4Fe4S-binding SPASM domain